jgi:hypothetical protein
MREYGLSGEGAAVIWSNRFGSIPKRNAFTAYVERLSG